MTGAATTIHDILDELRTAATDEWDKGDKFEKLMDAYLKADPLYQDRYSNVWRWADWPGRENKVDTGIDLVAEEHGGDGLCNVAEIVDRHTTRIMALLADPGSEIAKIFEHFVVGLRGNLNNSITRNDAIDVLSQHLITKPVFHALFEDYSFAAHNPVSIVMQKMVDALDEHNFDKETEALETFYESVSLWAEGIYNAEGCRELNGPRLGSCLTPTTAEASGPTFSKSRFQPIARRPQSSRACASCGHIDGCQGGCMAAKFFTGMPLNGPDPECVLGHGAANLAVPDPEAISRPQQPVTASIRCCVGARRIRARGRQTGGMVTWHPTYWPSCPANV